jgi:hypothetical protein
VAPRGDFGALGSAAPEFRRAGVPPRRDSAAPEFRRSVGRFGAALRRARVLSALLLGTLLQGLELRDHVFGIGEAAAEPAARAAAAPGDDRAVDEHVELAEFAEFTPHGQAEGILDGGGKTCRAWAEASRSAVSDQDVHARAIVHRPQRLKGPAARPVRVVLAST